ncbi:MAG: hypothetical protein DCC49_02125 [Acidobacteria bacterium]|nr:MAG: hypothetical protein DCC49_02125 [Acidobacteriota bacterium]
MLMLANEDVEGAEFASTLDSICREGAKRMLAAELEAEVAEYVSAFSDDLNEEGHRLVVRNGHHNARTVTTAAGALEVRAPRVNDKRVDSETGERHRFVSKVLPPWCRKSPKVVEVLPLLYLHGLSTGDFTDALGAYFGSAAGLSASVISRRGSQARWRKINGPELVALVRAGARFEKGVLVESCEEEVAA